MKKLHKLSGPFYTHTYCGVGRVGVLPYVKGGMESNFVWNDTKVTCETCRKKAGLK